MLDGEDSNPTRYDWNQCATTTTTWTLWVSVVVVSLIVDYTQRHSVRKWTLTTQPGTMPTVHIKLHVRLVYTARAIKYFRENETFP